MKKLIVALDLGSVGLVVQFAATGLVVAGLIEIDRGSSIGILLLGALIFSSYVSPTRRQ